MFSVVIPLYNKELSIQNTIQSVLEQTYQEFEIIVIDDGSTDNSAERVREISDSRVKLVQQKNQGVSAARNRGIKESKFEWIALLDGDDLWEPNHLEEILKMMHEFPDEKVYVTSFKYSNNQAMYKHDRPSPIFKIENYFREALKEKLVWTSIAVIHRSCFDVIGGFNIKLSRGEDLDLWERLAEKFDIIKSDTVTAVYRIEAENRSFQRSSYDIRKSCLYYYDFAKPLTDDQINYYKHKLVISSRAFIRRGDIKSFIMLYKKYRPYISLLKVLKIK